MTPRRPSPPNDVRRLIFDKEPTAAAIRRVDLAEPKRAVRHADGHAARMSESKAEAELENDQEGEKNKRAYVTPRWCYPAHTYMVPAFLRAIASIQRRRGPRRPFPLTGSPVSTTTRDLSPPRNALIARMFAETGDLAYNPTSAATRARAATCLMALPGWVASQ